WRFTPPVFQQHTAGGVEPNAGSAPAGRDSPWSGCEFAGPEWRDRLVGPSVRPVAPPVGRRPWAERAAHDERLPRRRPRTALPTADGVVAGCAVAHQPSVGWGGGGCRVHAPGREASVPVGPPGAFGVRAAVLVRGPARRFDDGDRGGKWPGVRGA